MGLKMILNSSQPLAVHRVVIWQDIKISKIFLSLYTYLFVCLSRGKPPTI